MVDILMATYNGDVYISDQIKSILSQTYQSWNLLISDDGSSDNTLSIIDYYVKGDDRICSVPSRNRWGNAAGNFLGLLTYSTSDYVMFSDQDDVWDRNKIEASLEIMHELEGEYGKDVPLLVFTDSRVVDSELNVLLPSFVSTLGWNPEMITLPQAVYGNVAQGSTMLMNRQLANLITRNADFGAETMHDWIALLLALSAGHVRYLDAQTMSYRQHERNAIGAKEKLSFMAWLIGYIKRSHAVRGSMRESKNREEKSLYVARTLLRSVGDVLSDENRRALTEVSAMAGSSLFFKIGVYRKYHLTLPGSLRSKLYQYLGLLQI